MRKLLSGVLIASFALSFTLVILSSPEAHAAGSCSKFGGLTGVQPVALVTDSAGNVYSANYGQSSITKISANGSTTTKNFATTGSQPTGIAIDSSGNLYTSNYTSNSVSKVTSLGTVTNTSLGAGKNPMGIAVDSSGNAFTSNSYPNNVSKVSSGGTVTYPFASTGSYPYGISVDSSGNIYTANYNSNSVTKITSAGTATTPFGGTTGAKPQAIVLDSSGNLYTANLTGNSVTKISSDGTSTSQLGGTTGDRPGGIVLDSSGNVYTANWNGSVTRISSDGSTTTTTSCGSGLQFQGIAISSTGRIFLADYAGDQVYEYFAPASAPGSPTSVIATATGSTTAYIAFTAPASNGGAAIETYTVTSSPGSITATGTSSPISISGLTPNTAYTFVVKAANSAGAGSNSTSSSSITTNMSNTSTLTGLATSKGTLSPTFSSGTTNYSVNVSNSISSITVTPSFSGVGETVTVNGSSVSSGVASGSIALNVGSNSISIIGNAQDGSRTTYTISAQRADTSSATVAVKNNLSAVVKGQATVLVATASQAGSITFKVNGTTVSGCESVTTSLTDGVNTSMCSWTPNVNSYGVYTLSVNSIPTNPAFDSTTATTQIVRVNTSNVGFESPVITNVTMSGSNTNIYFTPATASLGNCGYTSSGPTIKFQYSTDDGVNWFEISTDYYLGAAGVWNAGFSSNPSPIVISGLSSGTYAIRIREMITTVTGLCSNAYWLMGKIDTNGGASAAYSFDAGPLSTTVAVAAKNLTAGTAATAFTPISASGGSTPRTYSV
ncbi:MAG: Serine/threonine-protein kinase PknD, partial [Actinomycetota bacterium]